MDAKGAPAAAYRFDRFTLDLARGALLGPDGAVVPLRPKSFALLRLLVEHAGRLLDRDTILATIWPDVVVGEEAITQCVHAVRKALGDEAQRLLQTVPKRGYLLAAEVVPTETTAPVPRVERRLAAILAADIVGYSRLIEADEAATLAAIKSLREGAIDPLLAEHKGRIVKLMGDGAIVEFASVVDAVACAVEVQKAVGDRQAKTPADQRIVFRIGVNLGDVVVEGDDLLGDGVNVAARLEQLCEPGGVLVSGTAFDHLQGRLGLPLEFTGEQQVKNIARPVRAYRVRLDGAAARLGPDRSLLLGRRVLAAAAVLCLILAAAAGGWWWQNSGAPAQADRVSVAILPFENLSGDERLGRLADGMVVDIIGGLSASPVLSVIARGTAFMYRDKPHDVRSVGQELGVRYVVEGNLQGDGGRLRANVALVDTETGAQLWSERYDRPLDDLFSVQDELTQRIANAIGGAKLQEAAREAARRKPLENLQAYELILLGKEQRWQWTKKGNAKGIELIQRALDLDPRSAVAYAELAYLYNQQIDAGFADSFGVAMAHWLEAARSAVSLDPSFPWGHMALGTRYMYSAQHSLAAPELERALQLAPGSAEIMGAAGPQLAYLGQPERGVELVERAVQLDPNSFYRDAEWQVYFLARRFAEAAAAVEKTGDDPGRWGALYAAASYAQLGWADELERWRTRAMVSWPDYSFELGISETGEWAPSAAAERKLWLESIVKAGFPVCATPEQVARLSIKRLPECDAERAKQSAT